MSTNSEGAANLRSTNARSLAREAPSRNTAASLLKLVLVLFAFVALVALPGCSLPGLSDGTARYSLAKGTPSDVVLRVKTRLSLARLAAEVTREGDTLLVRATKDRLEGAVAVLALPSGLAIHELSPRCSPRCEGSPVAQASDDNATVLPGEKRVFLRQGEDRLVPIAVRAEPRAVALASELVVSRSGSELVVEAKADTTAARLLASEETLVLVSGTRAFYIGRPSGRPMVLHFGSGLEAYERARVASDLLASPEVPWLGPPNVQDAPQDLGLAAFSLVLPLLLSIVYVGFVRRFDRAHPEPLGLVAITFVLGAGSAVLAGFVEWFFVRASAWTTPQLLTFGGQAKALPLSTLAFALLVGVPEEGAKLLATIYATRRREFDEPVDGVVYGVVSGLGFAAAENVGYFGNGRLAATLVVGRAFTAIPIHVFLSGLWGHALGERLVRPKQRIWPWFLAASLLHGAYDAAMSTTSGFGLGLAIVLGLAAGFIFVLRASLRHGPVSAATVRAAALERRVHAFGRGPLFPVLAMALPFLATVLLGVSAAWENTGASTRSPFTWPMVLLVVVVGAVLWGITSTLPLDAVVDAHGVTFAGAVRGFSEIDATVVHGAYLEVRSVRGDIEIGPGLRSELETLAAEIREGRNAVAKPAS